MASDRRIFTLWLTAENCLSYDPMVIQCKLLHHVPDIVELHKRYKEENDPEALETILNGISQTFDVPRYSPDRQDGLLGEDLFAVLDRWYKWCGEQKKSTETSQSTPTPTATQ